MAAAYVLLCDEEDYTTTVDTESGVVTGTCAAPYYGPLPTLLPDLSIDDGLIIAGAIGGVWALGVCARLLIRAGQQEYRHT